MNLLQLLRNKYKMLREDRNFAEILLGTGWAMGSRVGSVVLELCTTLLITRRYGTEAMGVLALVISSLSIITIVTLLGTGTSILRLIPEHLVKYSYSSAFKVYRKTQCVVLVAAVVAGICIFLKADQIAESVFDKPHLAGIVGVSALGILFRSTMILNQQAVRGLKLFRTYALLQVLPYLAVAAALLVGYKWAALLFPTYAQLFAWAITGLVGAALMDRAFRKQLSKTDVLKHTPVRSILTVSLPMLMTASMAVVISQTGVIVLGIHGTEAEVAYYAIAVKLATLTAFVLQSINTMAAPTFAQLYPEEKVEELILIAIKSTRLIFWTTTPILSLLLLFGRQALAIFNSEFTAAYHALAILVVGQFFNSISGSTGSFLNMTGHHIALQKILSGAVILNIVLNAILTPRIGIVGSAIAASTSLILWNSLALIFIRRKFGATISYFPISIPLRCQKRGTGTQC